MPVSVGVDIVDVDDVEGSIRRFGNRYVLRVFTSAEVASSSARNRARCLAACFAAKEAAIKALRPPPDEPVSWRLLELRGPLSARPELVLSGNIAERAHRLGVRSVAVSVTVSRRLAAALVLLEMSS